MAQEVVVALDQQEPIGQEVVREELVEVAYQIQ
jgi:hypothetical protein